MSTLSRCTMGAMASKKESSPSPVSSRIAAERAGEQQEHPHRHEEPTVHRPHGEGCSHKGIQAEHEVTRMGMRKIPVAIPHPMPHR